MTLAELLNEDEVTSSAVVSNIEPTPQFISDTEVDKLASLIESFAEKYETTLEELNSVLDKTALFGKKKNTTTNESPVATPTNAPASEPLPKEYGEMSIQEQRAAEKTLGVRGQRARKAIELNNMEKKIQGLEAGKTLASHPWVVPAVAGALGAGYLVHSYDKQNQMMGGA